MPILNDLKKLFFGAKSVAKHQGERAEKAARDIGDELGRQARELADQAPELAERGKRALSDLGDRVYKKEAVDDDSTPLTFDKLNLHPQQPEGVPDTPPSPEGATSSNDGRSPSPATPPPDTPPSPEGAADAPPSPRRQALDDTLDAAARTGNTLLDQAARAGGKLKDRADDLLDRVGEKADRIRREEAAEQARRDAERRRARERAFGSKEAERSTDESTLSGTDSFFDRADRFAEGDYTDEGGKPVRLIDKPDFVPPAKGNTVTGLSDDDGDGDPLIDDAILDEEDPDKPTPLPPIP